MEFRIYKPGLHKLIHHLDHLKKMQAGQVVAPIHISIWPTVRCQCACAYCCCRNEDRRQADLGWWEFIYAVDILVKYGTKALEFAGGGEPTLWPEFSRGVRYAAEKGLKVSLITNGLSIERIPSETLSLLDWVRVSLQNEDHARKVDFDYIREYTQVSASVIYTLGDDLSGLHRFVKKNHLITRIAIAQPSEENDAQVCRALVDTFGAPFFYSRKEPGQPAGCYMAWIRAAIDWRGCFLPCPTVMLAPGAEGKINDVFRLCHVSRLEEWLNNNPARDLGYTCAFCNCGKEHNDLIHDLITEVDNAEFV